jgi:hypothetical protein
MLAFISMAFAMPSSARVELSVQNVGGLASHRGRRATSTLGRTRSRSIGAPD